MKVIHIMVGVIILMFGLFSLGIVSEDSVFQTFLIKMFGMGIVALGISYLVKTLKAGKR